MQACIEMRLDDGGPDPIAEFAQVQAVVHKQIRLRLTVGAEEGPCGGNEVDAGPTGAFPGQSPVHRLNPWPGCPARQGGGDLQAEDGSLGFDRARHVDDVPEPACYLFRCGIIGTAGDVVGHEDHQGAKPVRRDQAFGEHGQIRELRTAVAARERMIGRQVLADGLPQTYGRTANEQYAVGGVGFGRIAGLQRGDVVLPAVEGGSLEFRARDGN